MNLELLALILKFHAGQVRKGNREDGTPDPQIEHIFRIIHRLLSPLPHYPEALQVVRMNTLPIMVDVAMGHDLLEDAEDKRAAEKELKEAVHEYAFDAIKALTRPANAKTTYMDYIKDQILPNPVASLVKLADIEDNIDTAKESLRVRYEKAKQEIMDHWNKKVVHPPADTSGANEFIAQQKEAKRIITDPNG